jgi:hypothetical protein
MVFEYLDETRFPDTRLARQEHDLTITTLRLFPTLKEQRAFGFPADERSQPSCANDIKTTLNSSVTKNAIDDQWLDNSTKRMLAKRFTIKIPLDESVRCLTDDQGIRFGQSLDARSNIGNLAQCQLFLPTATAHLSDNDQSGMKAKANSQFDTLVRCKAGIQGFYRVYDAQSSMHCSLGIILVSLREAEVYEQTITEILRYVPIVTLDNL